MTCDEAEVGGYKAESGECRPGSSIDVLRGRTKSLMAYAFRVDEEIEWTRPGKADGIRGC